jgi:hypothetical protein
MDVMRLVIALLVIGAFTFPMVDVQAQSRVPQFKDYPVREFYRGKSAPVVLTRDNRMFRTRLRRAAQEKPNFAGHYIFTAWGCGTRCLMGAVIDARTGKTYWWDFSLCCWGDDVGEKWGPIEFRLESKLIVFIGARNENENDDGAHFYKFENGRFVHLQSVMKRVQQLP